MKTPVHEIAFAEPASEGAAVRALVDMVLLLAIKDKASEIRFQPTDVECRLSYRIGDAFKDMVPAPAHVAKRVVNVIKVMADLDFATPDRPKERWINLKLGNCLEKAQVIIQPSEKYEEAIIRLLHPIQASEEASVLMKRFLERRRFQTLDAPQ